jgi:hypothetical protein
MTSRYKKNKLNIFFELKTVQYGLNDWELCFVDSPRDSYAHCIPALKLINIENESVRDLTEISLQQLLLHEIAHAIAGGKVKHGAEFRKVCRQIGCRAYMANNCFEVFELRGKFSHEIR